MDQIHLHDRQHHLNVHHSVQSFIMDVSASSDSRLPQWSIQETKELVGIRAELDQNFMETKRNKQLWEVVSNAMKDKGYHRSAEQCKCKWKNLVTRYKGSETGEAESIKLQQFPLYNELQAIFTGRVQRMVWAEADGGGGSSTRKNKAAVSSDEEDDDNNDEDQDHMSTELGDHNDKSSRRKAKKGKTTNMNMNNVGSSDYGLKAMVEELMRQQMQIESQWVEAFEAREKERKEKEREWRETMEALEKERMMMDQRWREREEQRRVREEARAGRRDALITALLNNLTTQDMMMMKH